VSEHGGQVVRPRGEGDSRFAVFSRASEGVSAACAIQIALVQEFWPLEEPLRVRMALHTGEADLRLGDYYGPAVNRCARLRAVAHGGQTLLSGVTAEIVHEALPDDASLLDLGIHRLKDLAAAEHVFQLAHPTLPGEFPPLRSLTAQVHNLPVQLSSFIGREREVADLAKLLAGNRQLTLTGTGGAGKTRLALQVAAELVGDYADGVWLVDLAPLADPALVSQAIASVLGIRGQPGHSLDERLIDSLRSKQLLLVLDNCEHLIQVCADITENLLRACPRIKILATSREQLAVVGEIVWRVPSLDLPRGHNVRALDAIAASAAVRLFVERAQAAEPTFQLTAGNAVSVAEICQRLDGIPLALELAAARIQVLSPAQIAARLSDCLRLLVSGRRAAPSRQQTLKTTIQWSYDLLTPVERRLFGRLSVFAGWFSLEATEAVCSGDGIPLDGVLTLVSRLVDQSLVVAEPGQNVTTRYRLLETIRLYAHERLLSDEVIHAQVIFRRHGEFYLALAEHAEPELGGGVIEATLGGGGPHQRVWLERLESKHDNLRAALRWSSSGVESEIALRLAVALAPFWRIRGYLTEGRAWLSTTLSHDRNAAVTRARALYCLGNLATAQADFDAGETHWLESLRLYRELDDKSGVAAALGALGFISRHRGDRVRARLMYEEALTIARELGATRPIASELLNIAAVDGDNGDLDSASRELEEATMLFRGLGASDGLGVCLLRLAIIDWLKGDYFGVRTHGEKAVAIFRELGDKGRVTWGLLVLGEGAYESGDFPRARALLEEALELARELEAKQRVAWAFRLLGALSLAEGEVSTAREHLERSLAIARNVGETKETIDAVCWLAQVAQADGDQRQACELYHECLGCLSEQTDRHRLPKPFEGAAALVAALGQPLGAARLFGAADAFRRSLAMPLPPVDQAAYSRAVADARAAGGRTAFELEWAAGAAMTIEQALASGRETLDVVLSRTPREPEEGQSPVRRRHMLDPLSAREE
jgi:predicted ATPase